MLIMFIFIDVFIIVYNKHKVWLKIMVKITSESVKHNGIGVFKHATILREINSNMSFPKIHFKNFNIHHMFWLHVSYKML